MPNDLWNDFQTNRGRVIHKWKHYFPAYERHFGSFRDKPILFIEIGCGAGGSLSMWKRYFGPSAMIVGLDINPDCKAYEEDQIAVRIGDQSDPAFLDRVLEEFGTPDIVLDDGSHVMQHIQATFNHMYPRVQKNAVYAVEDLHTAYWPDYGGGLHAPASFIERCKTLIDELNAGSSRNMAPVTPYTRETVSMHFYDSMVFFEKGRTPPPLSLASGNGTIWEP